MTGSSASRISSLTRRPQKHDELAAENHFAYSVLHLVEAQDQREVEVAALAAVVVASASPALEPVAQVPLAPSQISPMDEMYPLVPHCMVADLGRRCSGS